MAALLAELDAVRAERDEARAQIARRDAEADAPMTPAEIATARAYVERRDAKKHAEILARAERAEAGLAALREATATLHDMLANPTDRLMEPPDVTRLRVTWEVVSACVTLERILADTAAAAEAYTRRVEAKALDAAADAYECDEDHDESGHTCPKRWLGARADEIRGGR